MLSESNTITGSTGLLRTQHAQTGAEGQFRLSLVGEWFDEGFLCTTKFPCPSLTSGGSPITSDTMNHVGGTLSLGVSLFRTRAGSVDFYGSIATYANSDTQNRPGLLQVLGDSNLGVKYVSRKGNYVNLGAFAELWLINGTGAVGLDGGGTSAKLGILSTIDLRGQVSSSVHLPVRISVNAGYEFDNTATVLASTESQLGEPVSRIDRYGLGVNRVDHFDFLAGVEAFVLDERIRPFVEGHVLVASNRQHYQCNPANPGFDRCLASDPLAPATVAVGVRFFPWKRSFSLLAAGEFGLTSANFIEELQPVPVWTVFAGAGWAVDTRDRPVLVQRRGQNAVLPHGHIVGFVHAQGSTDPTPYVIATYRDRPDLSPLATAADGKFGDDVPPGSYTYELRAEGFKTGRCDAVVPPLGATAVIAIDCSLEPLPHLGSIVGQIRDADTSQPISAAPIVVSISGQDKVEQKSDTSGAFRFESLAPGNATLQVEADGYMVQIVPIEVRAHRDSAIDLMLRPLPKQPNVVLTAHELAIKQQIQFALDSAVILPDSYAILGEITDTFIRHPEMKLTEVQGHTDNTGSPEHNRKLSEARAEAVRNWIVQHGVDVGRLVSHGYGPDKPLVPNTSPGNRGANRRVQFIIKDRDASAAPPSPEPSGAAPPGKGGKGKGEGDGGSAPH
jgi:outer membrane protein OmpA-like peptidoglycan-associated protein